MPSDRIRGWHVAILCLLAGVAAAADLTKVNVLDKFDAGINARYEAAAAKVAVQFPDVAKVMRIPIRRTQVISLMKDIIAADPRTTFPDDEPTRLLADAESWLSVYAGALQGSDDAVKQQLASMRKSILDSVKNGARDHPKGPDIVKAGSDIIDRAVILTQRVLAEVHLDAIWSTMPDHLKARMKGFASAGFDPDTEVIRNKLMESYLADCVVVEGERAKASLRLYLLNYFMADLGASKANKPPELDDEALRLLIRSNLGIQPIDKTPGGKPIVHLGDFQVQIGALFEALNEESVKK